MPNGCLAPTEFRRDLGDRLPGRDQQLQLVPVNRSLGGELGAVHRLWMGRYGLQTKNKVGRRRNQAFQAARDANLTEALGVCRQHGDAVFVLEGRGSYRCKRCRQDAVTQRRRKIKEILVAEAGGRCRICGYDRHPAALEFHHLDPAQKLHAVSRRVLSLETLPMEARKCVLLCSNCHAEVENGAAQVPEVPLH